MIGYFSMISRRYLRDTRNVYHTAASIGIASLKGISGQFHPGAVGCMSDGEAVRSAFTRIRGRGATSIGMGRSTVTKRRLSCSSQISRRRQSADDKDAVEKHFSDSINKYLDYEDNSAMSLEEIAREQKRKIYSIKKARAAREFQDGPDMRTLSWDTIDQIRYLRQENPNEWSVALLAESFNVSEDVIVKVLRSKFTPKRVTREKQDQSAAKNTGYLTDKTHTSNALLDSSKNVEGVDGGDSRYYLQSDAMEQKVGTVPRNYKDTRRKTEPMSGGSPRVLREERVTDLEQGKKGETSGDDSPQRDMPRGQKLLDNIQTSSRQDFTSVTDESKSKFNQQENTARKDSYKRSAQKMEHGERREKEEKAEKEFTFGKFDFENVDSLMGHVELKPQVIRKGRNFYNEKGEFLYRI